MSPAVEELTLNPWTARKVPLVVVVQSLSHV